MSKLKSCPFCGGDVYLSTWGWLSIRCSECDYEIENRNGDRDNKYQVNAIIDKWNTRHVPEGYKLIRVIEIDKEEQSRQIIKDIKREIDDD